MIQVLRQKVSNTFKHNMLCSLTQQHCKKGIYLICIWKFWKFHIFHEKTNAVYFVIFCIFFFYLCSFCQNINIFSFLLCGLVSYHKHVERPIFLLYCCLTNLKMLFLLFLDVWLETIMCLNGDSSITFYKFVTCIAECRINYFVQKLMNLNLL